MTPEQFRMLSRQLEVGVQTARNCRGWFTDYFIDNLCIDVDHLQKWIGDVASAGELLISERWRERLTVIAVELGETPSQYTNAHAQAFDYLTRTVEGYWPPDYDDPIGMDFAGPDFDIFGSSKHRSLCMSRNDDVRAHWQVTDGFSVSSLVRERALVLERYAGVRDSVGGRGRLPGRRLAELWHEHKLTGGKKTNQAFIKWLQSNVVDPEGDEEKEILDAVAYAHEPGRMKKAVLEIRKIKKREEYTTRLAELDAESPRD